MAVIKKTGYPNVVAVLKTVADAWMSNNPTYVSSITTPQDLVNLAQSLEGSRNNVSNSKSKKRGNTRTLDEVNRVITKLGDSLRHLVKAYYPSSSVNSVLGEYGFVLHTPTPRKPKAEAPETAEQKAKRLAKELSDAQKEITRLATIIEEGPSDNDAAPEEEPTADAADNTANTPANSNNTVRRSRFIIPTDNDNRAEAIQNIINKLSSGNDIIASKDPNILQLWIDAQAEHRREWTSSARLKANTSTGVGASSSTKEAALALLGRLRKDIVNNFNRGRNDSNRILRSFGFLAEIQ